MIRRLAALFTLTLFFSVARADVGAIDYTDLWWDPAENGWGVAVQRQGDVLFVSVYHYAADGSPTWYVASDVRSTAETTPTWTGKLYRATGPAYTRPFDGTVDLRETGSLTLAFSSLDAAQLTYSADGVTVSKSIERMTFRVPSAAGDFYGGFSASVSRCNDPNFEGPLDILGPLTVTEANDRTTLRVVSTGLAGVPSSCTFSGQRQQAGRSGAIGGTYTCNIFMGLDDRGENPRVVTRNGNFKLDGMAVGTDGFSARLEANDQDCAYAGRFGGVKARSGAPADRSGFWAAVGEAGWGAQVTQQGDTVFLTLYVYDAAGRPTFFVGSGLTASVSGSGEPTFSGTLYRTAGTPRGAPYESARFHADAVGVVSVQFSGTDSAVLGYSVDNIAVAKTIRRQVWRPVALTGVYKGGVFVSTNGCAAGFGFPSLSYPGSLAVAQSNDQITIDAAFEPGFAESGTCRYSGRLVQQGGVASITQGTYHCEFSGDVDPTSGTFEVTDLQIAESGFAGKYRANQGVCLHTGNIGGIVRGYVPGPPRPGE